MIRVGDKGVIVGFKRVAEDKPLIALILINDQVILEAEVDNDD